MEIIEFTELTDLKNQTEYERAKLVCFYNYKETGMNSVSLKLLCDIMQQFGFSRPNSSRLKEKLTKGKGKTMLVKANGELEIIPIICQELERELGNAWEDTVSIDSNSELIDEIKFCGKKPYIDQIIKQINFVYANNCYDACAILMRRLFEILLVLAYQRNGIESDITNSQGQHFMLEGIVKNAKNNTTLNISSRVCKNFDAFREVGNNSAHSITYTASKKDIDDIKISYRVMLDELYDKAGLI